MLTGTKPFPGDDVSQTLARVIDRDPDWDSLPATLSPSLDTYLRRCLRKDLRQRVRDIGDVRLALEGAFETTVSAAAERSTPLHFRVWQRPVPAAMIAATLVIVSSLGVWSLTRPEIIPPDLMRFAIVPPETAPLTAATDVQNLVISPDGTQVVYSSSAPDGVGSQLNLQPLDQLVGAPLRGGEGGVAPFFSPDGEWVGFVDAETRTILQKVSIFGGAPVMLAELPSPIRGASWATDDQIVFGRQGLFPLFRVSGGGGDPEALTLMDSEGERTNQTGPFIIPDRDAVVFVHVTGAPLPTGQLAILDLESGDVSSLGLAGVSPRYISTGHLVYATGDGTVRAVPFDATTLTITGSPVTLIDGVMVTVSGAADFSISDNGRLVYALGAAGGRSSLVWVDRAGAEERIEMPRRDYRELSVSPDGTRVALSVLDQDRDIWVWDFARETLTRLTFDPGLDVAPRWTPDGQRVVFSSQRNGRPWEIYWKAADGTGTAERLM